ncbi:MAG TPA: PcfJ domain-containing protein, partial [Methanothrix soehngenii]|nr:PcfJ domain-containing protein [Methanothrix soehngenii]
HCVGSYANRVAEGDTTILFLRAVTKPDKPFYTLEWRKDRLVQIRGDHNVPQTPEVAEFVEQWQQYISKPRKQRQQKKQPAQMMAAGQ